VDNKAQDIQELFASDQGKRVLGYLKQFIKPDISKNKLDAMGRIDPYAMMKDEGKRAVWCHIDALLNKDLSKEKKVKAKNDRGS
jgi:hypothetical protein